MQFGITGALCGIGRCCDSFIVFYLHQFHRCTSDLYFRRIIFYFPCQNGTIRYIGQKCLRCWNLTGKSSRTNMRTWLLWWLILQLLSKTGQITCCLGLMCGRFKQYFKIPHILWKLSTISISINYNTLPPQRMQHRKVKRKLLVHNRQ